MHAETLRQRLPQGQLETEKVSGPCLMVRFPNQPPQAQDGVDAFLAMHKLIHSFDPKIEAYRIPIDQPLPFPRDILVDFFEKMNGEIVEPQNSAK